MVDLPTTEIIEPEFLGIDNNTIDKWIRIYNFPVIRIDGIVRFDIKDIKDFMNTFKTI